MPPTVQPERRPPRAPAINGHAAFAIAFSISDQSRFSFIFVVSLFWFGFLFLTTGRKDFVYLVAEIVLS